MRYWLFLFVFALLAGCGSGAETGAFEPDPPPPDTSLEEGDTGRLKYAGVLCNSVDLYKIGQKEGSVEAAKRLGIAIDRGNCVNSDEPTDYEVLEIGEVVPSRTGCSLDYMVKIQTPRYGIVYDSSDNIPGITQDQIDYRVNCLNRIRESG